MLKIFWYCNWLQDGAKKGYFQFPNFYWFSSSASKIIKNLLSVALSIAYFHSNCFNPYKIRERNRKVLLCDFLLFLITPDKQNLSSPYDLPIIFLLFWLCYAIYIMVFLFYLVDIIITSSTKLFSTLLCN